MQQLIIDTNILARFLVGNVPDQQIKAEKILQQIESGKILGEISILVINELIWVMEGYYELERKVYFDKFRTILGLRGITIKELKKETLFNIMVEFFDSKLDFTDLYLLRTKEPGQKIVSFDKAILKHDI
jgi:predicted nucleic-acid-binding protein